MEESGAEEDGPRKRIRTRANPEGLSPFERDVVAGLRSLVRATRTVEAAVSALAEGQAELTRGLLAGVDRLVGLLERSAGAGAEAGAEAEGGEATTPPASTRESTPSDSEERGGKRIPEDPRAPTPQPPAEVQQGASEDVEMTPAEPEAEGRAEAAGAEAEGSGSSEEESGSEESESGEE